VDWVDPAYRNCITLIDDDKPASYYLDKLKQAADQINRLEVPYNPFLTNSNAAAREMLERAGIPVPKESLPWVPGWGTKLPDDSRVGVEDAPGPYTNRRARVHK
jgi:hypothetical protein